MNTEIQLGNEVHVRSTDLKSLLRHIELGVPYHAISALQSRSGFSISGLSSVTRISTKTLDERRKEGRFRSDETERLLRFAFLFEKALACFSGDQDATRSWLERPNAALGDETPLRLAETEFGARAVEDLIGRLEHGVFS